ncbi:hypothetical protein MRB53_014935 [Persea americana]|uniref:Uncharacterized protein n=1 Tax=Persea americana TaxID=3435 RepID=A0ACC2KCR2_PERAE|nr:hypothetical protein MRB53_014935 [Persea americana]
MSSLSLPLSSTKTSLKPLFFPLHKPRHQQLQNPNLSPSTLSLSSPNNRIPRLSLSNQDTPVSAIPIQEIVEKDWSFVDSDSINSPSERSHKTSRIISAARIGPSSRILVSHGTEHFVEQLVGSGEPSGKKPFELLLVVHESLFELALIKEKFDDGVRCWQGGILEVPQKWANFDAVFICYLPGLGFSTDQIFAAMGRRCSPGARLVIGYAQGREIVARHLQQHPDMVNSALPDKATLEKVAADHSFEVTEFVDEPTFYLAVLEFCKLGNSDK